jgi:general stress protein CsbA
MKNFLNISHIVLLAIGFTTLLIASCSEEYVMAFTLTLITAISLLINIIYLLILKKNK